MNVQGITIDDVRTRDIDDAVWAEETDSGWRVWVSIADVAKAIFKDSGIDKRAKSFVATRYFATGNSPMLPRKFSEQKLSLWPGEAKPVLTVELELTKVLGVRSAKVYEARVQSKAKLAYSDIPQILGEEGFTYHESVKTPEEVTEVVKRLRKLGLKLLHTRRDSGALVHYDLNNGWVTTEEGFLKQLERREDTIGYIIIQELMVLANAAVAELAIRAELPVILRNHTARPAAPPRDELMAQIMAARETPIQGLDTLRQRVHMLVDKADFGTTLKGHYGLNLPAYMHFTSPIRRYGDLVNHRILRAWIRGEAPPYTREEAEAIAAHLNEAAIKERESAKEHFLAQAEDKARRAVDSRRLDGLNAKDFERVTKVEARSEADASDGFREAFVKRAGDGRLPLICMTVVLGESGEGPNWDLIRKAAINQLAAKPADAVSLLAQATQVVGWEAPEYESKQVGPPHAPTFTTTASMALGGELRTFTSESLNKKLSQQQAAVGLIAVIADVEPPSFDTLPKVQAQAPKAVQIDTTKDPVSALQELAQATGLPAPSYSFKTEGPSHAPAITCTCSFNGSERTAQASSKKAAKKIAASYVVEALTKR